jgi:hypothetical protein
VRVQEDSPRSSSGGGASAGGGAAAAVVTGEEDTDAYWFAIAFLSLCVLVLAACVVKLVS